MMKEFYDMVLGLNNVGDTYQRLLETSDESDCDVFKDSLCNLGTRWIDPGLEKTVRRMDLHPNSKLWYQFIKHSICPTANNEIVNKVRLVLLHYITSFS